MGNHILHIHRVVPWAITLYTHTVMLWETTPTYTVLLWETTYHTHACMRAHIHTQSESVGNHILRLSLIHI